MINSREIEKSLTFLKGGKGNVEIRCLGSSIKSGYFSSFENIDFTLGVYKGKENIYFTLNEVSSDVVSRSYGIMTKYAKHTTTDSEIVRLNYIMIDLDPRRPAGISSSNEEHQKALDMANLIKEKLTEEGFKSIIRCDSGNGAHDLIPIDMENTKENVNLIKKFLTILDAFFSDDFVDVDTTTFNPSRICKLYGTYAVKGSSTVERPHRKSRILEDIDTFCIEVVPTDVVENFVEKYSVYIDEGKNDKGKSKTIPRKKKKSSFDVKEWIQGKGYEITKEKEVDDGILYQLNKCPFGNGHDEDGSTFIIQKTDGFLIAGCPHRKCSNESWDTLWAKLEPAVDNPNHAFSSSKKDSEGSIADKILKLVEEKNHYYFKNQFAQMLVEIPELDYQIFRTDGAEYSRYLHKLIYEKLGHAVEKKHVNTAMDIIVAKQMFDYNTIPTFQRFGCIDENYYYNLNDEQKRMVIVKKANGRYGSEVVSGNSECKFVPSPVMKKQIAPNTDNPPNNPFRYYMEKYFGVLSQDELILHNVLLVYRYLYGLTQPIGVFMGEKGSGKSTLSYLDAEIINPTINSVTAKPNSTRDWNVVLNSTDTVVVDNLSTLSTEESDLLCQAVQGFSVSSQRELYSDDRMVVLKLYTSIYMTSINLISYRSDLLSRTIFFHTKPLSHNTRKEDKEIRDEFFKDLPDIITGLFEVLVNGLNLAEARENQKKDSEKFYYRITSFQKYGKFFAEAMGYSQEEFISALKKNDLKVKTNLVLESDFAYILRRYVISKKYVKGTATSILRDVEDFCYKNGMKLDTYSNTPPKFGRAIEKVEDSLGAVGIAIKKRPSNGTRVLEMAYFKHEMFNKIAKPEYQANMDDFEEVDDIDSIPLKSELPKSIPTIPILKRAECKSEEGKGGIDLVFDDEDVIFE